MKSGFCNIIMSVLYVKAPMLCRCYVDPGLAQKFLDQFCSNSYKTCSMSQNNYAKYIFILFENQTIFGYNFIFSRSSVYFFNHGGSLKFQNQCLRRKLPHKEYLGLKTLGLSFCLPRLNLNIILGSWLVQFILHDGIHALL